MERDSVVFYRSYYEAAKKFPENIQFKVWKAILEYSLDGIEPELDGAAEALFIMARPNIDSNNKKYKAGIKGGRPARETNGFDEGETIGFEKAESNVDVDVDVDVDEDVDVDVDVGGSKQTGTVTKKTKKKQPQPSQKSKRKRFAIPEIPEIKDYCLQRKNGVDAEKFYSYYQSKGWMVGKSKMKDWKAAVITWEKNEKDWRNTKGNTGNGSYSQDHKGFF